MNKYWNKINDQDNDADWKEAADDTPPRDGCC